ncbi:dolichyl-phosphate beta-glucosyltransferase [Nonomuraea diastatica]|uniref:dolichyl-phosphate beta-glucosyltransferase n=1 Tax=Nonomuraea diastatica TaxID=1848329 RepID=A0A4R4WI21_9ACTN|nr:dolichyl-phosphate beta-glucosyltransferase [Nonomuraea diastatica]TDD18011.1 glycosyltransferase family 2 protein [Nonomuraea diastatica]
MDLNHVDLSVVIPAYNEERRLAHTLARVTGHLRASALSWEVVVVDDGSADATGDVAEAAAGDEPRVRVLRLPVNRGKGRAVREGVLISVGRQVLVCDADLATPIEELAGLREALARGADVAIGSRAVPGARIEARQPWFRKTSGILANVLIRLLAVPGVADTQCGFKLFDGDKARAAFRLCRVDGWGGDVEVLRMFGERGWRVREVPVRWSHQPDSKVRPHQYLVTLGEVLRIRFQGEGAARTAWVTAVFLALSVALYVHLWADPWNRYLTDGGQDQNQWEWFFAVTAHNLVHLGNLLFTTLQNHPSGVNLMANTVMLGLSVPLAPLTLTLGPPITWAVVLTAGLALTGTAWYVLFAKHLVGSWQAAAIGAGFCAFAPPIISHANAHPNLVVLFVIPLIVRRLLLLCEREHVTRDGLVLGLLVSYQVYLGEEALLLTATGLAVFAAAYALLRPEVARAAYRPLAAGLALAATTGLALTGPALVFQFFGPQNYASLIHGPAGNDVRALVEYAGRSLAGDANVAASLSMNLTEQNAFFGWPLLVLTVGIVVWLRRRAVVLALAAVIAVSACFALGPEIVFYGERTGIPGPWLFMSRLPLFESVVESRFTMVCVPAVGALLAIGADHALAAAATLPRAPVRVLLCLALAEALLPLAPTPIAAADRHPAPAFFTAGVWREYVRPGHSVVTAPLPDAADATPLHWQVAAGLGFPLAEGYFVGPYGPERQGVYGAPPRATSSLLREVRDTGEVPRVTVDHRRAAREDLAFWRADAVVLGPHHRQVALHATLTALLGPGRHVAGVWVWDVRNIVQPFPASALS